MNETGERTQPLFWLMIIHTPCPKKNISKYALRAKPDANALAEHSGMVSLTNKKPDEPDTTPAEPGE